MKRLIFLLLAMAGLLIGCSPEELDSTLESTTLKAGVNEKSTNDVQRPFKLRGEGILSLSQDTDDCPGLMQLTVNGSGQASHLGNFQVSLVWCTNFTDTNYASGKQIAANGDELYFYLVDNGVDENGEWALYSYEGGTGRFENLRGELYERITTTFTGPFTAVYTNTGNGWLSY
ncbi:hypothetical protein ACT6NV_04340 [Robiginitalea sp. IMCC44478]|uniref:hypothetical protein n=1 Tax=Robiginitalea sp. IMCC44478 TaxID=3459122 RepID=UPI004042DA51